MQNTNELELLIQNRNSELTFLGSMKGKNNFLPQRAIFNCIYVSLFPLFGIYVA